MVSWCKFYTCVPNGWMQERVQTPRVSEWKVQLLQSSPVYVSLFPVLYTMVIALSPIYTAICVACVNTWVIKHGHIE